MPPLHVLGSTILTELDSGCSHGFDVSTGAHTLSTLCGCSVSVPPVAGDVPRRCFGKRSSLGKVYAPATATRPSQLVCHTSCVFVPILFSGHEQRSMAPSPWQPMMIFFTSVEQSGGREAHPPFRGGMRIHETLVHLLSCLCWEQS
jgi:hypothetical protein